MPQLPRIIFHAIALVCLLGLDARAARPGGAITASPVPAPAAPAPTAKPGKAELKKRLTPLQYGVTQEEGTEPPYENAYWDNHAAGIYVDIVSGEPLFSSTDKYDSRTGWPSFTQPLSGKAITLKTDRQLGAERTEVRSKVADSHLGHVFDDGPQPKGQRYCMNSASLRFVPVAELRKNGLERYLFLFAKEQGLEVATLAGGCFWGMEEILRQVPGVVETQAGYMGGKLEDVTYADTHDGKSGHAESLQILFDPKKLSYEQLLLRFFTMHDPTTANRQGNDVGSQYRSAIFYGSEAQKKTAEAVKLKVDRSKKLKGPVVTEIAPAGKFWRAEDEHQKYLVKHPGGYTCHYFRKINFD